jgi:hypothetical protein
MWFTSLQLVKFTTITAGLEKNQVELIVFVSADYIGNARAKPRGEKVAPIN